MKAPGTKRLKLNCDEPLSNSAFNFNLRRFISGKKNELVARLDVFQVGPVGCCLPCHRMPLKSTDEGAKLVG